MSKINFFVAVLILVIGVGIGIGVSKGTGLFTSVGPGANATQNVQRPLFYRDPMNPDITSSTPAKDSMGMDYLPVYASDNKNRTVGTVIIDPTVVQNIGVRTAIAQRSNISRIINAMGRVDFDESRMTHLHPKVEGWIEEIYVDKTGQVIEQDTVLLSIYSPKLMSTQQEYLLALNNLATLENSAFDEIKQGAKNLLNSSLERLQLLDVPGHQIKALEKTRKIKKSLHIHSPARGTVVRIGARQGQYVNPKTELYKIVDLSQVWVLADIYENELPWVKLGDKVTMTLTSVPGKIFNGALEYIYPYAEAKTRTTKVRIVFDNPERLLRPEMFAGISIQSDTQHDVVVIPAQAIVRTGGRTLVFVQRDVGVFEPVAVTLGLESGEKISVLNGINVGDKVVTSAQFLLDSESKLREATAKMMKALERVNVNGSINHSMDGDSRHD